MASTSVSKTLNSCGRLQTVCQTLVINGTKIAELQTRIQELLKQQLATNSARAQQTCLLGTLQPRDELADPEFLISISSGDLNVLPAVALNFGNLVAKLLPITISSAAMVKKRGG